jgi:hypothetical protein
MSRRRTLLIAAAVAIVLGTIGLIVLATTGGGDDEPSADRGAFCERLDRLTSNDPFAAFGERATAAEIAQAFDALVARTEELVDLAPDDVRGAARDAADSATRLRDLLAAADGDASEVDPLAYRAAQDRYTEAGDRLERYLTSECR